MNPYRTSGTAARAVKSPGAAAERSTRVRAARGGPPRIRAAGRKPRVMPVSVGTPELVEPADLVLVLPRLGEAGHLSELPSLLRLLRQLLTEIDAAVRQAKLENRLPRRLRQVLSALRAG